MAALLKQLSPTRKHEMSLDDAVARTQELSAAAIEGRQFIFEKKALLLQELEDSFCEGNFTTPQPCMPGTRRNVRAQLQSGYVLYHYSLDILLIRAHWWLTTRSLLAHYSLDIMFV